MLLLHVFFWKSINSRETVNIYLLIYLLGDWQRDGTRGEKREGCLREHGLMHLWFKKTQQILYTSN